MKTFNVKVLYIYKFIGQCLPIYAFYAILFLERGMSVANVAVLIALWSAFAIVFEIPAGILADRWNRRNMLAIATVLQGLCFTIWFFSHTFFMFALGFAFWAIAGAFTSGTEESLIYDNLKSDGREEDFTKVYGKAQFYQNIGSIAGILPAGLIAFLFSVEVVVLISIAICVINVVFALQIRERNYYSKQQKESAGVFETFKKASVFIKGSGIALTAILFLVLFTSLAHYTDEFDAFIINDLGLNHIWVTVIFVVRFAFMALGDVLAPIVQKKVSSIKQIFILNGVGCVFIAVFATIWHQFALPIFGLSSMIMAIAGVLLMNSLQNEIKEEGRATVTSFISVGQNIVMICFSLVFALLAGIFALQQVYIIIAIYGVVGGLCFYIFLRVKKIKA